MAAFLCAVGGRRKRNDELETRSFARSAMGDAVLARSAIAAALALVTQLAPPDAAKSLLEKLEDAIDASELAGGGPPERSDGDWAGDLMIALFRGVGDVNDPVAEAARIKVAEAIEAEVALLAAGEASGPMDSAANDDDDGFWQGLDFEEVCRDARAQLAREKAIVQRLAALKSHELLSVTMVQPEAATVQPEAATVQPEPATSECVSRAVRPLRFDQVFECVADLTADMDSAELDRHCWRCDFNGQNEEVSENHFGELLCEQCREAETSSPR